MTTHQAKTLSAVSTTVRVVIGFFLLVLSVLPLLCFCLLVLPFRLARLWGAEKFSHWLAPALLRVLMVSYPSDARARVGSRGQAIFVINHTSMLDTFLSMAVWPRRACSVGKKEVLAIPAFGLAYAAVGMLMIDRSNTASAITAMNGLVSEVKRYRLSIWMAPEGTRSRDGELAVFKKGFVHMAIATGLPVVPVVFHGAFDRLPVDTWKLSPGFVDIEVLPSVDTSEWSEQTVAVHAAEVRALFAEALERRSSMATEDVEEL